ncbi:MAG: crossover junction endodeoxyribonuclease RuvC [Deltaproteobacteria bacterium]|nr:crossover junction endodeoxyribonuclease RuvC [Deltaproteobacteria bacterium]
MRGGGDRAQGSMRVLGIDPGTTVTGWGVVEGRRGAFRHLGHGTVSPPPGTALPLKLERIHLALVEQCATWRPDALALEKSFVGRNVQSAFRLGEVRGVAMLAAAAAGVVVAEYSPAEVKLAVTGSGCAAKAQVEHAIARELALEGGLSPDAADALALALCHLQTFRLRALLAAAEPRRSALPARAR